MDHVFKFLLTLIILNSTLSGQDFFFEQRLDTRVFPKVQNKNTETRLRQKFIYKFTDEFRIDTYMEYNYISDGKNSSLNLRDWSGAMRYTLRYDNNLLKESTFHLGYILMNGKSSLIDSKLLLSGNSLESFKWNLSFEIQKELTVIELSKLNYKSVFDLVKKCNSNLSLGFSEQIEGSINHRDDSILTEYSFGPNIKYKFNNGFIAVTPLFGLTEMSRDLQVLTTLRVRI